MASLATWPPKGYQEPRICSVPDYVSSTGEEALEIAAMSGLYLDPWQATVLTQALGEQANGKWAAFEVGLCVARQNGKNSVLEARELAGLFLLGEKLIIHSAHLFPTAIEHFRRMLDRIESCPDFERRVKKVSRSHGEEGIELKSGQRLLFKARTGGSGRGFTADCIVFDETMDLPEQVIGAVLPTLSTRPNSQVWYTGSAVDQQKHDNGLVFARIRERGLDKSPGLAYFEFSAPEDSKPTDVDAWAQANPGLGIRITTEHVALEQASMPSREFAVERLGIGDWPKTDGTDLNPISREAWAKLTEYASTVQDPIVLAFDVAPDRSTACIAAAGSNSAALTHVEVVQPPKDRRGTHWVTGRLIELVSNHRVTAIVWDPASPADSLASELTDLSVDLFPVSAREHANACGLLFDAVSEGTLRHLGTEELTSALAAAVMRPLADRWAWSRKNSGADISPLVAVTLAHWGYKVHGSSAGVGVWDLNQVMADMIARQAVAA